MFKRGIALLFLSIALANCAGTTKRIENPAVQLLEAQELPAPASADVQSGLRTSFINAGDLIAIELFGVEDLSRELRVDMRGYVDYPLIGQLQVDGLTTGEVATQVESKLRGRYVRDPHISVNIKDTEAQIVTVDGGVGSPGNYPVVADMTLMRAIAAAGGVAEDGDRENVIVFREVGGQQLAALYDLAGIRVGNYSDPAVYPNDKIVVNSKDRTFTKLVNNLTPLVPIILIVDSITNDR